mgnify:CR=1 FL=1
MGALPLLELLELEIDELLLGRLELDEELKLEEELMLDEEFAVPA